MSDLAARIESVQKRIKASANRAGRNPDSITLVAVTKKVSPNVAIEAIRAGAVDLGESRVQEAKVKAEAAIGEGYTPRWHMIGPLQTNKVKYLPGLFSLIHSIDRLELIRALSRRGELNGVTFEGLLQINIAGESQKSGCAPDECLDLLKEAVTAPNINITGLMTIPPNNVDPESARPLYKELLSIRMSIEKEGIEGLSLANISAGMSGDFEIAIEEGANIVRVGSAIFGDRS